MFELLWKSWNRNKGYAIIIFLIIGVLFGESGLTRTVLADSISLPEDISVVEDEEEMIKQLLAGMEQHQTYFAYYYPEIEQDFRNYYAQSVSYNTFMDKLAARNGYITGILSGSCITLCGTGHKYVTFQFHYLTTRKQEEKIDKKVRSIARKYKRGSKALRAKKAHDYLIRHMRYDERYYNPYYAFTKGRGICMSYALAYQRLMQEMKIPCIYIKGKNHAWNIVKIGSAWYNVDVTWDDADGGYRYFLKSDKDFPGHKRPQSKWLSSLKMAKRSYDIEKIGGMYK